MVMHNALPPDDRIRDYDISYSMKGIELGSVISDTFNATKPVCIRGSFYALGVQDVGGMYISSRDAYGMLMLNTYRALLLMFGAKERFVP